MNTILLPEYEVKFNLEDVYNKSDKVRDLLHHQGYKIYKITNSINNKCYIGDTKISIYYRFHTACHGSHFDGYNESWNGHLYNSMRKYGLSNFTLELLSTQYNEEYYITKYDSFYNGYNYSHTGLSNYGPKSTVGKTMVTNGESTTYVKTTDLDYWIKLGYEVTSPSKGYKWLKSKSDEIIYIKEDLVQEYLDKGFKLEGNLKGWKSLKSPEGSYTYVSPELIDEYLSLGYSDGLG
jgi:hypothetical protein